IPSALPRSSGMGPENPLLLKSTKLRLGKATKPSGMEPLRLLFWIRNRVREVQFASELGSESTNLFEKRMSFSSLLPLQISGGVGPSSELVDKSTLVSLALEPSF
ncbi:hypothetical protein TorRG33x02_306230, partial [Trema orientale]